MAGRRRRYLTDLLGRTWRLLFAYGVVYVGAAVGFYLLEPGISPMLAFYWSIVTLATIGYGDVVPTDTPARLFTIAVAFVQIFLLGYLLAVITGAVAAETQSQLLGLLGTDLKGHTVVAGYSPVGASATRELLLENQSVAVITSNADEVGNIRALAPAGRLFVTFGNPAEPEILRRANVQQARAVIVATSDDTVNLITVLNLRSLAPNARIVVSVARPELRDTMRSAGVTYVASPGDMGGRLCANAAFRPEVANAIEDLLSAAYGADLQEFVIAPTTPITGGTLGEAERTVRERTGALLVGFGRAGSSAQWETTLNPKPSEVLRAGDALLVLGSDENIGRFRRWFGVDQGR